MRIRFSNVNETFGKPRVLSSLLCLSVLILSASIAARAQNITASIRGTVTDVQGAAIADRQTQVAIPV